MIKNYPYMQEEQFNMLYYEHLIPSPEDSENKMWDTTLYEEVCKQQDKGFHIFTIIEGDDPHWYASPGFHIVNRVGYLVSSKPIPDSLIEAIWSEGDEPPTAYEEAYSRLDEAINAHLDTLTPDELRQIVFDDLYETHRKMDEKQELIEYVSNLLPDFDPEDYTQEVHHG